MSLTLSNLTVQYLGLKVRNVRDFVFGLHAVVTRKEVNLEDFG